MRSDEPGFIPPPERIEQAFEQVDAVMSRHYTKRDGRYAPLFREDFEASRWDEGKRIGLLEKHVSWESFGLWQAETIMESAAQGKDFRTEITANDYESLRTVALGLVEYEFGHILSHHQDPDYEPVDSWYPLPEAEKLAAIFQQTSVAHLPDDQGREFLGREIKFDQIPVAEQKRIMGETWSRFAPADIASEELLERAFADAGPTPSLLQESLPEELRHVMPDGYASPQIQEHRIAEPGSIRRHGYQPPEPGIRPLTVVRPGSPDADPTRHKPLTP